MAQMVLIIGESGTGKSTSMRNCSPDTTAVINPVGKPLPFKGSGKFDTMNGVTESHKITKWMKEQAAAGKKLIVVDDFQYILAIPYIDRIKENGWDKWNDFGANYFDIINVCKELPDDVVVAYLSHAETLENGIYTIKLIGKMLREKITIEGLFTVVLRTGVNEGKYYFYTQNSGKDTVKSPLGMFPAYAVDNDLNYIADKMRNYYEVGEYKSDEEMAQVDKNVSGDVEKPDTKSRRSRNSRRSKKEEQESKAVESSTDDSQDEKPKGRKSRRASRKTHDEVVAENNKKIVEYQQAVNAKVSEMVGDAEEVEFSEYCEAADQVEKPELETPPRRTRRERKGRETKETNAPTKPTEPAPEEGFINIPEAVEKEAEKETRTRRTRRTRS